MYFVNIVPSNHTLYFYSVGISLQVLVLPNGFEYYLKLVSKTLISVDEWCISTAIESTEFNVDKFLYSKMQTFNLSKVPL